MLQADSDRDSAKVGNLEKEIGIGNTLHKNVLFQASALAQHSTLLLTFFYTSWFLSWVSVGR